MHEYRDVGDLYGMHIDTEVVMLGKRNVVWA